MRKSIIFVLCLCMAGILCACSVEKMNTEKIRDIEFTVLEEDDIPKEMLETIQTKKADTFKITYADKGCLYIAEGYGERGTTGYSIEVKSCYETENAVYIHTNLIGPSKQEEILETKTYPYIVVKMEFIDKNVVFE